MGGAPVTRNRANPPDLPACTPWYTRQGNDVLVSRDFAAILRFYRRFHGMSQESLAQLLRVDRTLLSRWETGNRPVGSVRDRHMIAEQLRIPPGCVGLDGAGARDHAELISFGFSVVRLATAAREEGRSADALRELDQLVEALDERVRSGRAGREDVLLLAAARTEIGVALGDLLPEAHLGAAALWTGSGVRMLKGLDGEPRLSAHALRMYGNELRKAGAGDRAMNTLRRAAELAPDIEGQATANLLLARAASEAGAAALMDEYTQRCRRQLEQAPSISNYFVNPFSLREVRLRGLLLTDQRDGAERFANASSVIGKPSPTWAVMERVTMAQFHLATGEKDVAESELDAAMSAARAAQLPHQVERAIRLAESAGLLHIVQTGIEIISTMTSSL
jgi:transcriptional regulator with XRE-family HTH domain